jgi:arginyl-tRNA synthetase
MIFKYYKEKLRACVGCEFILDPPKNSKFGHLSTNAAMILAKSKSKNPREVAEEISSKIRDWDGIESVSVDGPGFINITLKQEKILEELELVNSYAINSVDNNKYNKEYGIENVGNNESVLVEFLSANPTGPLHAAHARIAIIGDTISSILEHFGYSVIREFYSNDSGVQIKILSESCYFRYLEALGLTNGISFPDNGYPGEYVIDVAKSIISKYKDKFLDKNLIQEFEDTVLEEILNIIKSDLINLDINFDVFTSEKSLEEFFPKAIDQIKEYTRYGTLETPKHEEKENKSSKEEADVDKEEVEIEVDKEEVEIEKEDRNKENKEIHLLFCSTRFGDDLDRVLQKSNGEYTYFAKDIAYHIHKYNRSKNLINVMGADHGGYIKRIESALEISTGAKLRTVLCQIVNVIKDGKLLQMSKRAGTFVTVEDILNSIDSDVLRFVMLSRKHDTHIDLDIEKVLEQSKDNPVFYVQYAYARIMSALQKAKFSFESADLSLLKDPLEIDIISKLIQWPLCMSNTLKYLEPHRIIYYLIDVSSLLHSWWTAGKDESSRRFITKDIELSKARCYLLNLVGYIIKLGLKICKINIKEEM